MTQWKVVSSSRKRKVRQQRKTYQWLALGKDVWRIVFTMLIANPCKYSVNDGYDIYHGHYTEIIGAYEHDKAQLLRSVCLAFATWISPVYCLGIIYLNPTANTSQFITRWKDYFSQMARDSDGPTYEERNPFFARRRHYLSTKWKWRYNQDNFEPQIAADDEIKDIWRREDAA